MRAASSLLPKGRQLYPHEGTENPQSVMILQVKGESITSNAGIFRTFLDGSPHRSVAGFGLESWKCVAVEVCGSCFAGRAAIPKVD